MTAMMRMVALAAAAEVALAPGPALAHHSRAMFNVSKNVTYRGVVREYRWQNPHSQIVVAVESGADPSTVGTWVVEASAIGLMTTMGWTLKTYKADGTRLYRATHRYPGEDE